ncbi:hypothetical protein QBC35DRAFT_480440 [Podospora australis]|uniref:G-patch domain-containing protein n=1 Tax=Podospora australis TaxID=1536484 RepID=A0AAN7ANQ7_9PEZI|nr:hypothetical protein QBC35DRAFT_480440 [Podospora australis]
MTSRNHSHHRPPAEDEEEDFEDDIPLHHRRPFGAGLYKQRIAFLPASSSSHLPSEKPPSAPKVDEADLYLSILGKNKKPSSPSSSRSGRPAPPKTNAASATPREDSTAGTHKQQLGGEPGSIIKQEPLEHEIVNLPQYPTTAGGGVNVKTEDNTEESPRLCLECNLPLPSPLTSLSLQTHETSLPHQLSLPHSHPPSHLDRTRMGLTYLTQYGWDPDSRKGLGASQQGLTVPIKPKPKDNRLGIGIEIPKGLPPPKPREKLLDAKKVRKMAADEKRKGERLREELFGDGKIEKYLGKGAGSTGGGQL